MLTRDLLRHRVHKGHVRPRFIAVETPAYRMLATALLDVVAQHQGETRGALQTALASCYPEDADIAVARGLTKLVLDRCAFSEPPDGLPECRLNLFAKATAALRSLPAETHWDALRAAVGPLPEGLYNDLPEHRRLVAFRAVDATTLLHRYNMALAQGLLLSCASFVVTTTTHDVLRLRRVLRWLKFCRLVAAVQVDNHPQATCWTLQITGPAEILAMSKAYGLQLAQFLPAVPLIAPYRIDATIAPRAGQSWRLHLTEADPLVSPHRHAMGHMPAELQQLQRTCSGDGWFLDPDVMPRHVGPSGMMLPDFVMKHTSGVEVFVELFHRWHQHSLAQRLAELQARPDCQVLLGVDTRLARQCQVATAQHADGAPRLFAFNGIPSRRRLHQALQSHL